jgi:Uma2 family endonuclease
MATHIPTREHVQKQTMTRAAFLALPESNLQREYIYGEAIMAPAPAPDHQISSMSIIKTLLPVLPPSGIFLHPPSEIWFGDDILQPDLFWIREKGDCLRVDKHWEGAPDLIVEILSPSNAKYDRSTKFKIYEQYGVREYWLVSYLEETDEVYVLENAKFARYGVFGAEDSFSSQAINNQPIPVTPFFEGLS